MELHIKEKFHIARKNELESELIKLKNSNHAVQEGVIYFWKKNK